MATRMALGASRWRIVRQLLTESLMLAALAGVIGVAIANWGSRLLLRIAVPAAEQPPVDLTADHRMLAFTAIVVLMTAVLIGLIPALRATAPRPFLATRQIGGRRRIADRVLVASQVALSLVLLVGAGLFLRTIANIRALDTGYNRQNVLIFSLDAAQVGKRGEEARQSYRRVLEELQGTPGAQSIAASIVRPVSDNYYFIDSVSQIADKRLPDDQRIRVAFNLVAPGYFGTLGIPLLAGRDFDDRDSPTAPKVVIVSERMARHFVGDPIGQRIGGAEGMEVVGVVKDIRYANVKDAPREVLYFPMFQATSGYTPSFEIKYAGDVSAIVPFVREAVGRVDPRLTIFRMKTLERQTEESLSRERLLAMLTSYFGGFAVLLACIGLYGLMSYGVNQRTPEMGLRMALGAKPSAVRWIVVREATTTVVAGAALGVIAALAAVRLVRSQLFGVEPHDPVAIGVATLVLLTLALLAAYLPARRASRIDPLVALRHE
jgi:predicted permease